MTLNIQSQFTGIQFKSATGELIPADGPRQVINSSQINHELLATLYASNYDDNKLALDSMVLPRLSISELEVLGSIGIMQFDMNDDNLEVNQFEYKSLLDTYMVTSIDIPDNIVAIKLFNDGEVISMQESEDDEGWIELKKGSRKLILSIESPTNITNVSEELHNLMRIPHKSTNDIILKQADLIRFDQLTEIVTDDGYNKQTNSKLFDTKDLLIGKGDLNTGDSYAIGDTEYLKGIVQELVDNEGNLIKENYIIVINFESKKL